MCLEKCNKNHTSPGNPGASLFVLISNKNSPNFQKKEHILLKKKKCQPVANRTKNIGRPSTSTEMSNSY